MQLACPPYGVSLPQAEQACTPGFSTSYLTRFNWGTKIRALMGPKGSFAFLFLSFLSPRSGIRVSRDDPSGW